MASFGEGGEGKGGGGISHLIDACQLCRHWAFYFGTPRLAANGRADPQPRPSRRPLDDDDDDDHARLSVYAKRSAQVADTAILPDRLPVRLLGAF